MLEFHPAASQLPLMDGTAFDRLVESIRGGGLLHPIVICDDKILDGRNRYRACLAAGVEPDFVYFEATDPAEIAAFVDAANNCRVHQGGTEPKPETRRFHRPSRRGATMKDGTVVSFVTEFRRQHGRNPSIPEMRAAFPGMAKATAQRYRTGSGAVLSVVFHQVEPGLDKAA